MHQYSATATGSAVTNEESFQVRDRRVFFVRANRCASRREAVKTSLLLEAFRRSNKPGELREMNNTIEMLSGRRFLAHHIGAEVYYDTGHQVIKTSFTGGGYGELIKELQPDGRYRNQILFIVSPEGDRSTMEYTL
jgi:hypothetical protein